jgi:hypothetical protein
LASLLIATVSEALRCWMLGDNESGMERSGGSEGRS